MVRTGTPGQGSNGSPRSDHTAIAAMPMSAARRTMNAIACRDEGSSHCTSSTRSSSGSCSAAAARSPTAACSTRALSATVRLLERQRPAQRPAGGWRERRVVAEQRLEQRGKTRPREGHLALRRRYVDRAHPGGVDGAQQRCLADARSAHDRDRRPALRAGSGRKLVQSRQVVRTSEQRGPLPVIRGHAAMLRGELPWFA